MGKTRFEEATEFIERHFNKDDEVGLVRISCLIMKEIGSDDRTIQGYLETMIRTKLIEDIGNCRFKILWETLKKPNQVVQQKRLSIA